MSDAEARDESVDDSRRPRSAWPWLLAGVLTGATGLAVSHLTAGLVSARATPLVAVAEGIIELTPGATAEALIQLVGQWNKPLLIAGVFLGLLVLSALAGWLSRGAFVLGAAVFLGMGVVGLLAIVTSPQVGVVETLPVLVGTAAWFGVLALLVRPLRAADAAGGAVATAGDRRQFLRTAGGIALGAVLSGVVGELVGRTRRGVTAVREALNLPVTSGEVPEGATFGVPGVAPWQTPNPAFYRIDTALVVPQIVPDDWRLRIHGLVENELELTYADLVDRELAEAWTTICCVSNAVGGGLIGNAWWSGVPIASLLDEAGVLPGADAVLQTSADDWNCGTPIEALTDDRGAIVALAMNGEPLPPEHGFPARMIVPGLYGYVSATKWLVDLEVTNFSRFDAYWTERGWAERGPIKLQSRIDRPAVGATVAAGTLVIGGYAWAQTIGISYVEYRLDGGPWQRAELARVPGVDTWVQWVAEAEVAPGDHQLVVRATDRLGETQTEVRRDVIPDGATGWHTVSFTVA